MDLTGARWRLKSTDAVLKLRSLKASGDLSEYLQFHFKKELERNYGWAANDMRTLLSLLERLIEKSRTQLIYEA
jgi:hypothetical protein